MRQLRSVVSRQIVSSPRYGFSLPWQRRRTDSDLSKYDVVVLGSHLGQVFAAHIDYIMKGTAKVLLVYDQFYMHAYGQHNLYEMGMKTKEEMRISMVKKGFKTKNALADGGVAQIFPDKNEITLRSGKTIKYDHLVVALGQKSTHNKTIKGFEQAYMNQNNFFFTDSDHENWNKNCKKSYRFKNHFNGGKAIFYIPPRPYISQMDSFNFFYAMDQWQVYESMGKFSWDTSSFTVINGNDTLNRFQPSINQYLRRQMDAKKIHYQSGLKLTQIDSEYQWAIFQNIATGQITKRYYNHFYCLKPSEPHPLVKACGLSDSTGYLDVDPKTLTHKKYDNIYGIGDISNLPTTKTMLGGFYQIGVLRRNLQLKLKGLEPELEYDGYTAAPIFHLGKLFWAEHSYTRDGSSILNVSNLKAKLNFFYFKRRHTITYQNIVLFRKWGPPYYRTFCNTMGPPRKPELNLQKEAV